MPHDPTATATERLRVGCEARPAHPRLLASHHHETPAQRFTRALQQAPVVANHVRALRRSTMLTSMLICRRPA